MKLLKKALKLSKEIGYKEGEASALSNIGFIFQGKGDLDSAIIYLNEANEIIENYHLFYGKAVFRNAIEKTEAKKGSLK